MDADKASFSVDQLGLTPILNCTGGWTAVGATRVCAESLDAALAIAGTAVDIDELQDRAGEAIAAATGAELGMVVNCSAAGIVVAVAACIVGTDVGRAKRLPDTMGVQDRIVLQKAHSNDFGAPIDQMIRLGGGTIHEIGWCNQCELSDLELALRLKPAAGFYVVSYETYAAGQLPLPAFLAACHASGVPSIIDIAGEHNPAHYIALGADLVIISAHKQLGGLTAGVIAGKKNLVDACRVQMAGVGRPGKASKESIASTIVAMRTLAEKGIRGPDDRHRAETIIQLLNEIPAIVADAFSYPIPGETNNVRVRLRSGQETMTIEQLMRNLEAGTPRVIVRRDLLPSGYLVLNPRELNSEDITILPAAFSRALQANWQA